MDILFNIFSNREIAVLFWTIVIIISAIFIVGFKSLKELANNFFVCQIQIPLILMFVYIGILIFIFYKLKLWEFALLKDTVIWSFSSATVLFFNINKAKEIIYFKPIIVDNLKMIFILEFITNFYTFNLILEFIIIPIMTFLILLQVYADYSSKTNEEHKKVASCLKSIINICGLFILIYVTYKTFHQYKELLNVVNLKSLLLPIILTFIIIPYLYILALTMNYETLLTRIPYLVESEIKRKKLIKYIIIYANFNLNKLYKISTNLNKISFDKHNIRKSIRNISK
ncbi:hypothetical protein HNQ02_003835 [Flavobacterium sp. 7E]|uniref:hypothetical protein n=1 Tax=Flavobacterium sp. 7E TaxID=2735898 RepID=UPI00156ED1AC|nr:hypothetical protein [Flavobacterium sp. 7E]NRS90888.1 hypothetical protein [Flavobacterium sp. 7E]